MKDNEVDDVWLGLEVEHEHEREDKPVEKDYNHYTDEVRVEQP